MELGPVGDSIAKCLINPVNWVLSKFGFVLCVRVRNPSWKRPNFIYNYDYVRTSQLELVAHVINSQKVAGNVAELGVYRGCFSMYINRLFPDRKLYLFDTFEGFAKDDIETEKKAVHDKVKHKVGLFNGTSVDLVMSRMRHKENCIVRKGFFPETAKGIEDTFAFVSIDCDLYAPIKSGLEYFYPRLSPMHGNGDNGQNSGGGLHLCA